MDRRPSSPGSKSREAGAGYASRGIHFNQKEVQERETEQEERAPGHLGVDGAVLQRRRIRPSPWIEKIDIRPILLNISPIRG